MTKVILWSFCFKKFDDKNLSGVLLFCWETALSVSAYTIKRKIGLSDEHGSSGKERKLCAELQDFAAFKGVMSPDSSIGKRY